MSYKTCFSFLLNKTTASLRIYSLSINFTAFHKISVFRTINMHSCHRICHRGTVFKTSSDLLCDLLMVRSLGSVVILGGLSLVNSLHAYTFASLKRKKLISTTPLNDALNALILALNASAAAFVLLFTKKFRILS